YNLNAMMRKRYEELMDARAFNEWLQNRQLKRQGEEYADVMGRMAEMVNRRIPQLRWAGAERRQVLRAAQQVLESFEEGEPLNLPLPDRRVSTYVQSHFYLDEFPQPHKLGARLEDDYVSADDGYQGRPFPQLKRPSFLGPGPDTESEGDPDEAFRQGRVRRAEAATSSPAEQQRQRTHCGIGQAVRQFGFRNAELAAAATSRGGAADCRAQEVERAAAQDIETFAAEQAAEGGELVALLAEAGTQTAEAAAAEAAGGGILGGLAAAAEGVGAAAAAAFPIAEKLHMTTSVTTGGAAALAGGAAYGLYQGGRWLLSGNGGDAASSSGGEFPDVRTLNGMQQGTPQERVSLQQRRVQQPMVSRLNSSEDDAPMAQQQAQPRPQV
ncbi:unnamed protein product, partial [Symbiodinium pilosum]